MAEINRSIRKGTSLMNMLMEGLPALLFLIIGICVVRAVLRRARFDSEDVLQITDPSGRVHELRLSALRSPPQREEELRKITTKVA